MSLPKKIKVRWDSDTSRFIVDFVRNHLELPPRPVAKKLWPILRQKADAGDFQLPSNVSEVELLERLRNKVANTQHAINRQESPNGSDSDEDASKNRKVNRKRARRPEPLAKEIEGEGSDDDVLFVRELSPLPSPPPARREREDFEILQSPTPSAPSSPPSPASPLDGNRLHKIPLPATPISFQFAEPSRASISGVPSPEAQPSISFDPLYPSQSLSPAMVAWIADVQQLLPSNVLIFVQVRNRLRRLALGFLRPEGYSISVSPSQAGHIIIKFVRENRASILDNWADQLNQMIGPDEHRAVYPVECPSDVPLRVWLPFAPNQNTDSIPTLIPPTSPGCSVWTLIVELLSPF